MRLYHGSNIEIDKIDLSKCSPYKDFGRGFYTTSLEEQARRFANKKAERDGGTPVVTVFEVPDNLLEIAELNVRVFDEEPGIEWAVFVANNRNELFTDFESKECNLDNKYDIVVGPVANDKVGRTVRRYVREKGNEGYMMSKFKFGELTNQYTFHTEKALAYLKKVDILTW